MKTSVQMPDTTTGVLNLLNETSHVFVISFVITLLVTPLVRRLAIRRGVVDRPDGGRKSHHDTVAYLGGLAVFAGLVGGVAAAFFTSPTWIELMAIGLGMLAITATGLADDLFGWDPRLKVAGQLVAAAALVMANVGSASALGMLDPLKDFPPTVPIHSFIVNGSLLGMSGVQWIGVVIVAVLVLGGCNAANLIDGLDGLLTGTIGIVALGLLAISLLWIPEFNRAYQADREEAEAQSRKLAQILDLREREVESLAARRSWLQMELELVESPESPVPDFTLEDSETPRPRAEEATPPDRKSMLVTALAQVESMINDVHGRREADEDRLAQGLPLGWVIDELSLTQGEVVVVDRRREKAQEIASDASELAERLRATEPALRDLDLDDMLASLGRIQEIIWEPLSTTLGADEAVENRPWRSIDLEGAAGSDKGAIILLLRLDDLLALTTSLPAGYRLVVRDDVTAREVSSLGPLRVALCLALLGAVVGFLPHNLHPASIFLGDCGSLLFGFVVIVIILMLGETGRTDLVLAGLIVFALPIMDTILAMIRRKLAGTPLSAADDQHLHHQLRRSLGSVRKAVLAMWGFSALFAIMGVLLAAMVLRVGAGVRVIYAVTFVLFSFVAVIAVKAARREQWRRRQLAAAAATNSASPPQSATTSEPD